jgi:hypothetical protein
MDYISLYDPECWNRMWMSYYNKCINNQTLQLYAFDHLPFSYSKFNVLAHKNWNCNFLVIPPFDISYFLYFTIMRRLSAIVHFC